MSKVILFRPREVYSKNISMFRPPLGLMHLATALTGAGFSVTIIDTETAYCWQEQIARAMDESVVLAGIGCMTGYQIRGAIDFSRVVKKIRPVPVVWGGLHPSLLPDQTILNEFVDVVVIGEGEKTLVDVARMIQSSGSLEDVPNIIFKKDGTTVATHAVAPFLDMNELSLPDYSMVDAEYYITRRREFMAGRFRCIDLNTDRGCPYRCGFCYNLQFNKRRWRGADAEKVLADLERAVKLYRLDAVNFVSDNFFVKKDRVRRICSGILERGLDLVWHADMRIDTFLSYDDDLLCLMKKSGCVELTFGVETGSDRMLELIHKDISAGEVLRVHERALAFGFKMNYHFMIGFPEEGRADIIETLRLVYALSKDMHTKVYGPSIYIPYPGTTLFDRVVEMGFVPPNSLEGWISYDWESSSKLPWFSRKHKRYLNKVQFITFRAAYPPVNFMRTAMRIYFRMRLLGIIRGLNPPGIDVALVRLCLSAARIFRKFLGKV